MSYLELFGLEKAGSTVVMGSAHNGIQWGVMGADFLLWHALANESVESVTCVTLDRNPRDVISSVKSEESASKLVVLPAFDAAESAMGLETRIIASAPVPRPFTGSTSVEDRDGFVEDSRVIPRGSSVLFLFSFSELMFRYGVPAALNLVARLSRAKQSIYQSTTSATSGAVSTSSLVDSKEPSSHSPPSPPRPLFHSVIAVLHETLHSQETLRFIERHFDVTTRVRPNDGTLADTVVAQIHTIRRSPNTNKISEAVELFGSQQTVDSAHHRSGNHHHHHHHRNHHQSHQHSHNRKVKGKESSGQGGGGGGSGGVAEGGGGSGLVVLQKRKGWSGDNRRGRDKEAAASAEVEEPLQRVEKALKEVQITSSHNSGAASGEAKKKEENIVEEVVIKPMVIFDSNDPEFDEDSDPDNDLDL